MNGESTTASAEVDAEAFAAVEQWPHRCAPHGQPPVDHVRVPITSRPRRKSHTAAGSGLLGIVSTVAETTSEQRRVWVDNWPVCARCQRRRRVLRLTTRFMAGGGLAGFVGGLAVGILTSAVTDDNAPPWIMLPILLGLVMLVASAIPLTYAQPSRIARTWVTRDGEKVQLHDPDPEFARELGRLVES